jgi:hypothetical protein
MRQIRHAGVEEKKEKADGLAAQDRRRAAGLFVANEQD